MNIEKSSSISRKTMRLIYLSAICFIMACIFGFLGSLKIALPDELSMNFSFEKLRPLHTFASLAAILTGIFGSIIIIFSRYNIKFPGNYEIFLTGMASAFIIAGIVTLSMGIFSGREYISWHPALSLILISITLSLCYNLFKRRKELDKISPEGFWLLGFGCLFICAGLIETHLWLFPAIGMNTVKDLTNQWHGLDTIIAGMNAALYGCGIYMVQVKSKPLRSKWLFYIAGFSVLFTFGHHHYISPQPHVLKILAFIASMVAMISFIRHLKVYLKFHSKDETNPVNPLLKMAELWTIVSVGSGILFAIPYINLFVHGTYLIVIHAMGSMIGVSLPLILASGFLHAGVKIGSIWKIKIGALFINYSLLGLWLILGVAGTVKGVIRLSSDYWAFNPYMERILIGFPMLGLFLCIGIFVLCFEILRLPKKEKWP